MGESMIRIENVSKSFKTAEVLKDINLTVKKGEVLGLIGRNGSGKTVLLKLICGLIPATSGKIVVQDKEIGVDIEIPDNMGALIERPGFLEQFTGRKNLRFLASMSGLKDDAYIDDLIRLVGLDPELKKGVGKYSMGMKQRLGIAQAIMEKPDILILDEPTNGLDNQGVIDIRNLLKKLSEDGMTILLASHNREDIATLCNHIVELDHGSVIQEKYIEEK